jgi:hypothetical protein
MWTLRIEKGRTLPVIVQEDAGPEADPSYNISSLMIDAAWTESLAIALAAYLGVLAGTADLPTTPTSLPPGRYQWGSSIRTFQLGS